MTRPDDPTREPGCPVGDERFLVTRRQFLVGASATMAVIAIPAWMRFPGLGTHAQVQIAAYPRVRIASLAALGVGDTVSFAYPWDDPQAQNTLIRLGSRAGGGVGLDEDVVAFNNFCPHQGGPLADVFQASLGMAGPCPLHWTTFDLNRHGIVTSGHATEGLPQITLETEGDDIYATGVMGLIFGYYDNRVDPGPLRG